MALIKETDRMKTRKYLIATLMVGVLGVFSQTFAAMNETEAKEACKKVKAKKKNEKCVCKKMAGTWDKKEKMCKPAAEAAPAEAAPKV